MRASNLRLLSFEEIEKEPPLPWHPRDVWHVKSTLKKGQYPHDMGVGEPAQSIVKEKALKYIYLQTVW